MNSTGLLALNGIPGSGKTLDAVSIALKHYKSENRKYKFYIALFKHYLNIFINNNKLLLNILNKITNFRYKIYSIKIIKVVLKLVSLFLKFCLFLFLFTGIALYLKILIFVYLCYLKKIIKSINSLDYDYFCTFPNKKINNVYSSMPILLDSNNDTWSLPVTIFDLDGSYSFLPNSLIIIDELQLFIDSDEYKDKIKGKKISDIGKFLQSHRHFGIKQIIFTSQSPSRIFKKARNIVVGYLKQNKIINLPFIPISIMTGVIYYDFEFYGRYIPRDREERRKLPFDYKKVFKFFNRNKVYSSYDSRYLSLYNYSKPLLDKGTWTNYKVGYDYLVNLFENNDF